jgi:recombination protein RecT
MSEESGKLRIVSDFVDKGKAAIAALLPVGMDEGRFTRMITNACVKNPKLLDADRGSLMLAAMALAEMGLEPGAGQAALVPYYDTRRGKTFVQAQPMYQGLLKLAHNSGQVSMIYAEVVRSGDRFDYELGMEPRLTHTPSGQPGEITAAYMVVHYKDGGRYFTVMSRSEIDAVRARSKGSDRGPWQTDYPEMAKKTVLKRGLKMVPRSFELSAALDADHRAERGGSALPVGAAIPDELLESSVGDPEEEQEQPKPEPWKGKDSPAKAPARRKTTDPMPTEEEIEAKAEEIRKDLEAAGKKEGLL